MVEQKVPEYNMVKQRFEDVENKFLKWVPIPGSSATEILNSIIQHNFKMGDEIMIRSMDSNGSHKAHAESLHGVYLTDRFCASGLLEGSSRDDSMPVGYMRKYSGKLYVGGIEPSGWYSIEAFEPNRASISGAYWKIQE